MSDEIFYLTLCALLTAVLWIPYILALIAQMGLVPALMDTQHEFRLEHAWARRAQRTHSNAVENLVVFAALIIAVELTQSGNETTAAAAMIYFISRVAHAGIYLARIPVARTIVFFIGFVCQIVIGVEILT